MWVAALLRSVFTHFVFFLNVYFFYSLTTKTGLAGGADSGGRQRVADICFIQIVGLSGVRF